MRLTKQSFEIIDQEDYTLEGIKKFIEKCGRVCYKSEGMITDNSYEKFVDMLINRKHYRPLEFGTVYLKVEGYTDDSTDCIVSKYINNPWSKVYDKYGKVTIFESEAYITTNYRVIIENGWEDDLEYLCAPTMYHCKRHTVHMVLSRGVMDEFRTHVSLSHLAESSRFCNYSKDKFNTEIACVIPHYCSDLIEDTSYDLSVCEYGLIQAENLSEKSAKWVESMCQAEQNYMDLINDGCTAQEAREVLPLGVKSELISCGFNDAWANFFYRRCAKDAHPMAREIAIPLQEKFRELKYVEYYEI